MCFVCVYRLFLYVSVFFNQKKVDHIYVYKKSKHIYVCIGIYVYIDCFFYVSAYLIYKIVFHVRKTAVA